MTIREDVYHTGCSIFISFSHQYLLVLSLMSGHRNSPRFPKILQSILADLICVGIWSVSILQFHQYFIQLLCGCSKSYNYELVYLLPSCSGSFSAFLQVPGIYRVFRFPLLFSVICWNGQIN